MKACAKVMRQLKSTTVVERKKVRGGNCVVAVAFDSVIGPWICKVLIHMRGFEAVSTLQ